MAKLILYIIGFILLGGGVLCFGIDRSLYDISANRRWVWLGITAFILSLMTLLMAGTL